MAVMVLAMTGMAMTVTTGTEAEQLIKCGTADNYHNNESKMDSVLNSDQEQCLPGPVPANPPNQGGGSDHHLHPCVSH